VCTNFNMDFDRPSLSRYVGELCWKGKRRNKLDRPCEPVAQKTARVSPMMEALIHLWFTSYNWASDTALLKSVEVWTRTLGNLVQKLLQNSYSSSVHSAAFETVAVRTERHFRGYSSTSSPCVQWSVHPCVSIFQ